MTSRKQKQTSGAALIIVVFYITCVINTLAAMVLFNSATRAKIAFKQFNSEKALFAAEAGAECAVAYLMEFGNITSVAKILPVKISGNFFKVFSNKISSAFRSEFFNHNSFL